VIKKLLEALEIAHADQNQALFDRLKSVITQIGRNKKASDKSSGDGEEAVKDRKILMTEVMSRMLKQGGDKKLHTAYTDTFIILTKSYL
jgi:hypothetical protein